MLNPYSSMVSLVHTPSCHGIIIWLSYPWIVGSFFGSVTKSWVFFC